ncbi:AAA family ATPase [Saccharothrix luteola]|uniref:AAA family ATPase n=1 Tax=Saccharothrix luteola TaxID=2893018 RepID=UPI001E48591C|nr:AAA family ATPase [Saccharothrix luteola]MCC8247087.1 AAA family ATPase [Saccharothrix luteola]MCC8249872.1 AAA family ATPase [Saccharothrix luteola]
MDQRRLADVRAGTEAVARSTGSGYLIGRRLVLTARHVVSAGDGAWPRVVVRLGHPNRERRPRDARLVWSHPELDVALLELEPPEDGDIGDAVRWGVADGIEQVRYSGIGFPGFADYGEAGAGVEQLAGVLNPLSTGPHGSNVLDQDAAPQPGRRAWAGVSGAAVFCAGLLVGVVVLDDVDFGNRRLHAARLDAVVRDPGFRRLVEAHGGSSPVAESVTAPPPPSGGRRGARAAFRYELSAAIVEHTSTVVGRESQVRRLMAFSGAREGGYALVEAPAGFGKTTLVADLWRRHATDAWDGPAPDLVGFSLRRDLGDHTPAAFVAGLTGQLAALLDRSDDGARRLDELWQEAAANAGPDRPLLLVVDGLDEASPDRPGVAELLPAHVPDFTHVVVTSRPSPRARSLVPPHHPLHRAPLVALPPLSVAEVVELLHVFGSAEPASFGAAVHEVTRGEPLLARFTAQDVAGRGEAALAAYRRERPSDVAGYFRWQLDLLEVDAEDDTTWDALALLLAAARGLTEVEIAEALGAPAHRIRRALAPVRRFLIGSPRHELMHEEFAVVLATRLTAAQRRAADRRLLDWCRGYAEAGWPDDTPDYALTTVIAHVDRANDFELAARLVGRRRLELMVARTLSPRGVRADVSAVLDILVRRSPPDVVAEIRTALAAVNVKGMADDVPGSLLAALVAAGETARAEAHAALAERPIDRCRAFQSIAVALWRAGEPERCRQAVGAAVGAARAAGDRHQSSCLEELALELFSAGAVADGCEVIRIWARGRPVALAFKRIAPALVRNGAAQLGLTIARGFTDRADVAIAHALLALALAEAGQVDRALAVADGIDDRITGWHPDNLPLTVAKLAIAVADRGRTDAARGLVDKASLLLAGREHPWDEDRVGVAAARVRMGEPEHGPRVLAGLSRMTESRRHREWPEIAWWFDIDWDEFSGWAVATPRRDAAVVLAHQAVLAGVDGELLDLCADGESAEVVRAAIAISHVHAGAVERARDLLSGLTSDQGKVQVLLTIASALAVRSPVDAREAALGALGHLEAARGDVAVILARAGFGAEAIEVAEAIPERSITRGSTFARLADVLGLVDGPPTAEMAADLLDRPTFDSDLALASTADEVVEVLRRRVESSPYPLVRRAIVARDDHELRRVLPEFDKLLRVRATALAYVVRGQLAEGRPELARAVALHSLSVLPAQGVERDRRVFFDAVVRALAGSGRVDAALAVADRLAYRDGRAPAVVGLLEGGDVGAALNLLGEGAETLGERVADLLAHGGLTELAVNLPTALRRRAERNDHRFSAALEALVDAPDGTDPHAIAGYEDLRRGAVLDAVVTRLARAGRFETALAVIRDPQPYRVEYWDEGDGLPSDETLAVVLTTLATHAHGVPARRQWARELAETAHRTASAIGTPSGTGRRLTSIGQSNADKARALAAVTGYPGWADDAALAVLRDALRLSLDWNRYVFFSVLTAAIPFLGRLRDGVLERTAHSVLDVDSWWTA